MLGTCWALHSRQAFERLCACVHILSASSRHLCGWLGALGHGCAPSLHCRHVPVGGRAAVLPADTYWPWPQLPAPPCPLLLNTPPSWPLLRWYDRQGQVLVFITELLTDGSLRRFIRRKHSTGITLSALKRYAWQILQGLVYLHGHHPPIIHRYVCLWCVCVCWCVFVGVQV